MQFDNGGTAVNAIIWSTHRKYAVPNRELWKSYFESPCAEEREYFLLLILEKAEDNDERWDVFTHSNSSSTREEALFAILPHVNTLNELRRVVIHATDDMLEVYIKMIEKGLAIYRAQLRLARNNRQRWRLCRDMTVEILRDDALSEILEHSTSNGERWWLLFNTKSPDLKARALKEILTIRKTKRT